MIGLSPRHPGGEQITKEDVDRVLVRAGRNGAPAALVDLYFVAARVPDRVLREVLIGVWTAAEFPERVVSRSIWLHWFDVANRIAPYPTPAEPIQVYRGAISKHARGMSWTTDLERANWFANRFRDRFECPSNVYEVTAPLDALLVDVDAVESRGGRQEREIIVDPRRLPRVQRVREYPRRSR
ncbi:MAG: hypothetical protein U0234_22895 [Sandaracinus sp.]